MNKGSLSPRTLTVNADSLLSLNEYTFKTNHILVPFANISYYIPVSRQSYKRCWTHCIIKLSSLQLIFPIVFFAADRWSCRRWRGSRSELWTISSRTVGASRGPSTRRPGAPSPLSSPSPDSSGTRIWRAASSCIKRRRSTWRKVATINSSFVFLVYYFLKLGRTLGFFISRQ